MATGLHRVLLAAGVGAGIYGIGLGIAAKPDQPQSDEDAIESSKPSHLALETLRDIAIAGADDFTLLPITAGLVKRYAPGYKNLSNLILQGIGIAGAGVAGGIFGHDFHNYLVARQRASEIGDIDYSKVKLPDNRINPIDGFISGTPVSDQRGQMTGINSPAAQSLGHLATNNPFAALINSALTGRQPTDNSEDPRTKALAFSWLGSLLGTAIGSKGGIARATLMGVAGGVAGGSYGIFSAHNQNLDKNLEAIREVAIGSAPMLLTAGAIFGARKIPKLGAFIDKGLDLSVEGFSKAGISLKKFQKTIDPKAFPAGTVAQDFSNKVSKSVGESDIWDILDSKVSPYIKDKTGTNLEFQETVQSFNKKMIDSDYARKAVEGTIRGVGTVAGNWVAPVLHESGLTNTRWEQSVAVGHILTFLPHQALVVGEGLNLMQDNRRKKSKATNTMPSNRRN